MNCAIGHLHPQSSRTALYRVFVQAATAQSRLPTNRPSALRVPITACQIRSKTTKKQRLAREGGDVAEAPNTISTGKKSYKDRVAERAPQMGRKGFAKPLPIMRGQAGKLPFDEEIPGSFISLVDREGEFHPRVYKYDVLRTMDRATEHLVIVAPATQVQSTTGVESSEDKHRVEPAVLSKAVAPTDSLPVCRIFTQSELLERARKHEEQIKNAAKIAKGSKVMEIYWVIAPADLEMKCKQLRAFLEEGKKVEVTMLPPRRKQHSRKSASDSEMSQLLSRIQQEVEDTAGAEQYAEPDGKIGGQMSLFFAGGRTGGKKKSTVSPSPEAYEMEEEGEGKGEREREEEGKMSTQQP